MNVGSTANAAAATILQQSGNGPEKSTSAQQVEAAIQKHREEHAEKSEGTVTATRGNNANISV